jgi:hypothetical protein
MGHVDAREGSGSSAQGVSLCRGICIRSWVMPQAKTSRPPIGFRLNQSKST